MDAQSPDLASRLVQALEERGAPDAIALADLMQLEQHLEDAIGIVRDQMAAIVRRTNREEANRG